MLKPLKPYKDKIQDFSRAEITATNDKLRFATFPGDAQAEISLGFLGDCLALVGEIKGGRMP